MCMCRWYVVILATVRHWDLKEMHSMDEEIRITPYGLMIQLALDQS